MLFLIVLSRGSQRSLDNVHVGLTKALGAPPARNSLRQRHKPLACGLFVDWHAGDGVAGWMV